MLLSNNFYYHTDMENSTLIYILDDDYHFARLVQAKLGQHGFDNVVVFTDEKECLKEMKKEPKMLIVDYHLKNMTGLQFVKKVKSSNEDLYTVLISGELQNQFNKILDDRFIRYVDKFIIKGMDEINELLETVEMNLVE